jgi:hypothetical protein
MVIACFERATDDMPVSIATIEGAPADCVQPFADTLKYVTMTVESAFDNGDEFDEFGRLWGQYCDRKGLS